jgi:hypothetical protein
LVDKIDEIRIVDFLPKSLLIGYNAKVYDFSLIGTNLLHILLNPQVLGRNSGQRLVPDR